MFHRLKNPLRYPNDKSNALRIILKNLPQNTRKIVFPFFTGGGLETLLVNKGFSVTGFTEFKNLYEFWYCLLSDSNRLSNVGQHFYPIEDENVFYMMQENLNEHDDIFVRAALFFVINRCTEYGTVTTGKMMKEHPLFNEYGLHALKNFRTNKLRVFCDSHSGVIGNTNDFIICCAPKYSTNHFMAKSKSMLPENPMVNHDALHDLLGAKKQWILLTEYHKNLIEMYKKYDITYLDESYNGANNMPSNILITNGV